MTLAPTLARFVLPLLLLLCAAPAVAQPFPPFVLRGPAPGPIYDPFGRLDRMQRWLWGPVIVPAPRASVEVRIDGERAVALPGWLRQQLRADLKARRSVTVTLGEALMLGLDVDVKLGGSFFRLEDTKDNLQIALVVDGTDSMGRDIDSLRQTLQAFVHQVSAAKPEGQVSFALFIYRDTEIVNQTRGRLQEVTRPLPRFTTGVEGIGAALDKVGVATGAPYFEELADEGLYQALTELDWRVDENTSRWIILCGDAPPYAPLHPARRHLEPVLVGMAQERGVQIHSILCRSGFVEPLPESYGWDVVRTSQALRPHLRLFMGALALGTGGQFLDLSDPSAVERLVYAAAPAEQVEAPGGEEAEELPPPDGVRQEGRADDPNDLPTPAAPDEAAEGDDGGPALNGAEGDDANPEDADGENLDGDNPAGAIRGLINGLLSPGAED